MLFRNLLISFPQQFKKQTIVKSVKYVFPRYYFRNSWTLLLLQLPSIIFVAEDCDINFRKIQKNIIKFLDAYEKFYIHKH